MVVAVTGGSGTLGRHVVAELARAGHEVRVLTRRPPADGPGEHRAVDLAGGKGLDAALAGVDVVIDAADPAKTGERAAAVLVDGTARLLAAERRAGVAHHVAISIAGIEKVPHGDYAIKLAQERAVRDGRVPWSIVRATQSHDLLDASFAAPARAALPLAPGALLQPVDPRTVARVVAEVAESEPLRAWEHVAGPEIRRLGALARTWRAATGRRHALVVAPPLPQRIARSLAGGALVPDGAVTGGPSFGEWLAEHRPGPVAAAVVAA
jgi:uncharacterized protein YbjT (DUF2867 family)